MVTYRLGGFSRFEINKKDYNNFLKKSNKFILKLKDTKKLSIFLEIEDQDQTKIKNTLLFIFFLGKEINFKMARLTFTKVVLKEDILKNKNLILNDIILRIDDPRYNVDVDELLDFTKSKFL